jgi:PPM family protein phosphatase
MEMPAIVPRFRGVAISSVGQVRERNEDAFGAAEELGLFVVCDGMGGHVDGAVASELAVRTVLAHVTAASEGVDDAAAAATVLHAAIVEANRRVFDAGQRTLVQPSMGTTVVALWAIAGHAVIGHVGDSRCYRLRGGQLERLTADHTVVEDARAMSNPELLDPMFVQRYAHVLTRSVGQVTDTEPEITVLAVEAGDQFLLCSDGLTGAVEADAIATILVDGSDPRAAATRLVNAANQNGGHDNITVLVAWAEDGP